VDDDGPADFDNIQAAVDTAGDGATIVVEKGVYLENIHFNGKNIILTGTDPKDPDVVAATIIDGGQIDSVVTFAGTENAQCVLSGFTIRNGYQDSGADKGGGGGICGGSETEFTQAAIVANRIVHNHAWDGGGLSRCNGLIEKNVIAGNNARWWQGGGGLYECNGIIRNNVIVGNHSWGCESAGALSSCKGVIENCTIAYNISDGYGPIDNGYGPIRNCIIWQNFLNWRMPTTSFSSTDVDPLFVSPGYWEGDPAQDIAAVFVLGDYHLKSQAGRYDAAAGQWVYDDVTSPCIDGGDPVSPIGAEPFSSGGVVNMGAYGGTVEASKSYFGKTPCETIVAGDINGDCLVNMTDFSMLALHWLEDHNP
jgi:hypothetical protein